MGGNALLERRHAWVVSGFIELVMEIARSRSVVLRYLVLYSSPLVGAVDEFVVSFLVRLRVHVAMGSFVVVL